ncbi:Sorting nexin-18 [Saguinus oedipus]|uniref:Sorting nexin-18 n=1 Tax=Saguinus oedipus TaxID=9490 RepID=A0ABQ9UH40_SAGOE|nr:Sorting nexin-18 [Saguinus oedipus]
MQADDGEGACKRASEGGQFFSLSQAVELDQPICFTKDGFITISELFASQPRQDLDPVMDLLGHQINILDIIHVHKEALTKVMESRQHVAEGKTEVQALMTSVSQEQDFFGHIG